MLKHEALEFVEKEIFICWPKWKPSSTDRNIWAEAFTPYTYSDAQGCFQRYYTSEDYTIQRPKIAAVLRYLTRTDNKIKDFVWIQNTKSGVFHEYYILGDKEKALHRLFQADGAPFGDGSWKMYEQGETTHNELFEYRHRKDKGLKSAIEHIDSEADAINIIETYQVDSRSAPAKAIKKAVKELKYEKDIQHNKEAIQKLKDEDKTDEIVKQFCIDNKIDDSDIEAMHQTEHVIGDDPF